MSFDKLIGNNKVKQTLTNMIQAKTVTHSYLFTGIEGIGKTLFAIEFAKIILQQEESDTTPDLVIIQPEENKIKIEQIRNMQSKILEKPIISSKKVYIIKDADTMTKEAQNCLLKTLEEPPQYIVIILIGKSEDSFLTTIKSRCAKIVFQPIPEEELKAFLEKEHGIKTTPIFLEATGGSIQKALKIQENSETYNQINEIFTNIDSKNLLDVLNKIEGLYNNKEEISEILDYINLIFFKKAKEYVGTQEAGRYARYMQEIENTKNNLKANCNYDMTIDNLLYNIWEK